MKSVLIRLEEYEGHASNAEKELIKLIKREPETVVKLSIHELAKRGKTSSSTIVRFCNKLEFQGYKDFCKAMIYELAVCRDAADKRNGKIIHGDSLEEIANKVTYRNIDSLERSRKLVDFSVLEKAVEELAGSEGIFLFGVGSSLLVAKDAWLKFTRVGKRCHIFDDWHGQLLYAKHMTGRDTAIMISYTGQTDEILQCAREVHKTGAKIIAVTRFENSALVKLADYCLSVASTENMFRSGAMASRISQLNMIDILYTAYISKFFDKSLFQINRTYMDKGNHVEAEGLEDD